MSTPNPAAIGGQLITFNDILTLEGIDPKGVRLIRHQDTRQRASRSLFEVWRKHPEQLDRYQELQSHDVFRQGEVLASFVATPPPRRDTLFIGLYVVNAVGVAALGTIDPVTGRDVAGHVEYDVARLPTMCEYAGRLTIDWGKGFRSWHQRARKPKLLCGITDQVEPPFPGFESFSYNADEAGSMYPGWKDVLRHVKGVYLLVDRETGARYVGSATGEESLWGRLNDYFVTGHGGNTELRRLRRRPYRFSVLQIGSFDAEILAAESAWKDKLMTRKPLGLNLN